MIELTGKFIANRAFRETSSRILIKVSTNPALPRPLAATMAFLCKSPTVPVGFRLYLALESNRSFVENLPPGALTLILPETAAYLGDGDILRLTPNAGTYRVLFRSTSRHTSILLTERCNHYCLMCSQPPKKVNDDWIMDEAERFIPMLPMSVPEIGFTGGEPTLYGERLIRLLELTKRHLPRTSVHVLSNGRRFQDMVFAEDYARIRHPDLMVGIPIYSDDPVRHNYVVQADNAFDETIRGILNLKRLKQRVEVRVVIHKQTVDRLTKLAEFIARNLLFVDQVALMGLEITGFTKGNLEKLWIDPHDYKEVLAEAVDILSAYRIPTAVYNHQLCVVADRVRKICVQSISDWKNEYLPMCSSCSLLSKCGGFFSSAVRHRYSEHIRPMSPA